MQLNASQPAPQIEIGTPVYRHSPYGDSCGWVAGISAISGNVYSLGSGAMVRQNFDLRIVFEDGRETTVSEGIAEPWIKAAARMSLAPLDAATVAEKLAEARAKVAAERAEQKRVADEHADAALAFRDKYRDLIPADAKAVLVAELEHDESDAMSDYFSTRTEKTVILAFSTHTRDLFAEMRKAARNFPETAALADADEKAEHREKYSMGSGYYLKGSGKYSTGWKVQKRSLYMAPGQNDRAASLPFGEWAVPVVTEEPATAPRASRPQPEPEAAESTETQTANGFTISHHVHTKRGFGMFIVETPERVTPDQFSARTFKAKDLKGWYSRAWGGTPAGFAFKDEAAAIRFAGCL